MRDGSEDVGNDNADNDVDAAVKTALEATRGILSSVERPGVG